MKKIIYTFFLLNSLASFGQPTWSEDAAEVFYENCTSCHHPEGVGTFSLLDYPTAYEYRALIQSYVEFNIMPPWKADSSFQHYYGERILTEYERNIIIDWANEGALEGDPILTPPPPVYTGDQTLPGTPDLIIEMPSYMSKATESSDDYVCISIPNELLEDKKIRALEVIPGNHSIVHHCLVYIDESGTYATDTLSGNCAGPIDAELVTAFTPGSSPVIFPATGDFSAGMLLPAGSNIVLALHYPHGSYGEYDQTRVNFYFYDEPVDNFRLVKGEAYIQNWLFYLPAHEITTVEASFTADQDYTVLSTFPHMHKVGTSIETYAIKPDLDTIPFVRIPEWDFDWQDYYWYKYMLKLPEGSNVEGKGVYDNTAANPHNPNDPPATVFPGLNTDDEMFLIYFHLMEYWEGDELINIDSLNTVFLSNTEEIAVKGPISLYPNPFTESININYELNETSSVSIFIYDMNGRIVKRLFRGVQSIGSQTLSWDGTTTSGGSASSGVYYYSMLIEGRHYSGRIIKK